MRNVSISFTLSLHSLPCRVFIVARTSISRATMNLAFEWLVAPSGDPVPRRARELMDLPSSVASLRIERTSESIHVPPFDDFFFGHLNPSSIEMKRSSVDEISSKYLAVRRLGFRNGVGNNKKKTNESKEAAHLSFINQ